MLRTGRTGVTAYTVRRTWRMLATAFALSVPGLAAAQAPAIQHYGAGYIGATFQFSFGDTGPGFFFSSLLSNLQIGALSYFNPDFRGGASSLGADYDVTLYTVSGAFSPPGSLVGLSPVLSARITSSSQVGAPAIAGTPQGAFWSTALPTPFSLAMNQIYAVFATRSDADIDGVWAYAKYDNPYQPLLDPRVTYLGSGFDMPDYYAGPNVAVWHDPNTQWQFTGASFNLTTPYVTPEPGTLGLFALGAAGLGAWKRRRKGRTTP